MPLETPSRIATAYVAVALVFCALDFVWLTVVASSFYKQHLGELLLDRPRLGVAVLFYALYVVGILIFVFGRAGAGASWTTVALYGALFGFFAYATYDLTNLATVRGFPTIVAVVDLAWGTFVTAASSVGGYLIFNAVTRSS